MDIKIFSSKENRLKAILIFLLFLLVILGLSYFVYYYFWQLNTLKDLVLSIGLFGPLILFAASIVQVAVAFIPGQLVNFLAGYFYGPFFGTLICIFGILIGASIAFLLSKRFGRPFVEKVIHKEKLEKFDNYMQKGEAYYLLIFLLFGFPDLLFFLTGLTTMRYRLFIIIVILGRLPGTILSASLGYGSSLPEKNILIIMVCVTIVYLLVIYIFRHNLQRFLDNQFD